jgi:hypothetical protein
MENIGRFPMTGPRTKQSTEPHHTVAEELEACAVDHLQTDAGTEIVIDTSHTGDERILERDWFWKTNRPKGESLLGDVIGESPLEGYAPTEAVAELLASALDGDGKLSEAKP